MRASFGGSFARTIAWCAVRTFALAVACSGACVAVAAAADGDDLHLVPRPRSVDVRGTCSLPATAAFAAIANARANEGARALLAERWRALGIVGALVILSGGCGT